MKAGGSGFQTISLVTHSTGPKLTLNFTGLTNGGDWQGKPENDVTATYAAVDSGEPIREPITLWEAAPRQH